MKEHIISILTVINNIFFILVVLLGVVAFFYDIIGHATFEKVFHLMHIYWDLKKFCFISLFCIAIWIVTGFLKKRL